MSYKPGSRKRRRVLTARRAGALILVVLLAVSSWVVYSAFIVKPAPIYARVDTTLGSFEVELFPASAPLSVANFVNLSQSGFYDNLVWHRIVPGFVIQTGDPTTRDGGGNRSTWGEFGSNTIVPLEIDPSLHNYQGFLAMANNNSQFYINLSNSSSNSSLDGKFTVFGKVVSGWDVVLLISEVPVTQNPKYFTFSQPTTPVYVTGITILKSQ